MCARLWGAVCLQSASGAAERQHYGTMEVLDHSIQVHQEQQLSPPPATGRRLSLAGSRTGLTGIRQLLDLVYIFGLFAMMAHGAFFCMPVASICMPDKN